MTKSQYMIAGTLLVLPTYSTDYFLLIQGIYNFGLRRPFYSKQDLKDFYYSPI